MQYSPQDLDPASHVSAAALPSLALGELVPHPAEMCKNLTTV